MTKTCEDCAAFSQLMAEARGDRVYALCLNPKSPHHAKMKPERGFQSGCDQWSDDDNLRDLR